MHLVEKAIFPDMTGWYGQFTFWFLHKKRRPEDRLLKY